MSRPTRSRITGGDGYAELEAKEKAANVRQSDNSPIAERYRQKDKEALAIRKQEMRKRSMGTGDD